MTPIRLDELAPIATPWPWPAPLDPDPLDLTAHPAYVLGYEHGWDDAPLARRVHGPRLRLLLEIAIGMLILGIAIGRLAGG